MMKMKELDYSRSGCHRLGYKLEVVLVDKALLAGLVIHKSAVEVVELTNYEVVIQNDYYKLISPLQSFMIVINSKFSD